MKKFILPSIFAFGLLFSCNNDDDSSINSESIVGTWSFVKYQTQFSKDNHIEDQYLADECSSKDSYTFTKDNKYSAIGYDSDRNNICEIDWTEEGTYSISGNKVRLTYKDGGSGEGEISKLTKNELILKSDYGEDLDGDGKNEIDILVLKR
ncbi:MULTISPECIES: lipocalin family protein [Empedobacter]|uniref:Lipocalin family protein n=2 Tax=Pseudomonadati TaxID=3379134 RepID=A0A7H9DW21_9FLAO|nr:MULTISPECIES: lipocalin family protein [Empedobacter]MDH2207123.1 lipocalin family protein [Empedobacter sp. GD03644]MDM1552736.1 lipocalin family protein [Empedobacter falsenii]QLL59407.1 lipocalin family protein [Empedobacter falsenii]